MSRHKESRPLLNEVALEELSPVRSIYKEYVNDFENFIAESPLIKTAFYIAITAHEDQDRKGQGPAYINHPYEAALLGWLYTKESISQIGNQELLEDLVATIFIHDVIEENKRYSKTILKNLLILGFHDPERVERIASWGEKLTPRPKPEAENNHEWQIRKIAESGRLLNCQDQVVALAKAADIVANARETLRFLKRGAKNSAFQQAFGHSINEQIGVFFGRSRIMSEVAINEHLFHPFVSDLKDTVDQLLDFIEVN